MKAKKNKDNRVIRNIKLVSENDLDYRKFIENIRQENFHLRPSNKRSYSDLISYPIEKTIREWISKSMNNVDERILRYECLKLNKYENKFNEIDSIFIKDGKYWLVEVKVSSSSKSVTKASKQLRRNYSILKRKNIDVELLIVHVDLLAIQHDAQLEIFNEDFSEMNFIGSNIDNSECHYLRLSPNDIFDWGVNHGFIKNSELLQLALDEAEEINQKRKRRSELRELNIPKDEWSEDVHSDTKIDDGVYFLNDTSKTFSNPFAEILQEALLKSS